MPKKGGSVVDPQLLEREKKNATTISMGMKRTLASTECWRNQCAKEKKIKEEWAHLYCPALLDEEEEIIERVKDRESERKEKALAAPERGLLLEGVSKEGGGRAAYLKARLKLPPQEKQHQPMTSTQAVGWTCNQIPPPKNDLLNFGRKSKGGVRYVRPGDELLEIDINEPPKLPAADEQ